jgi:CubicO group peptidase (beta-lactamase class C family)
MSRRLLVLAALLAATACGGTHAPASPTSAPKAPTAQPKGPPPPPATFDPAAIRAWVAGQVESQELIGAQLVVVREGKTVLDESFGKASRATGAPVTSETAFAIGSVTKQFTCAAAILLAQDGKLSMDDKVAAHYPALTRAGDITLDDLGSHLAGYPDYYPLDFVDRRMLQPIAPDDLIKRYASGALDFEPRTRWSYSNTGFVILGRVVEKVSGQSFGDFLGKRVFGPLGMTKSAFAPPPGAAGNAVGHTSFALGPPEAATPEAAGWLHAAGGMYASAADLARWDLGLIENKVLNEGSFKKLGTPRTLADGRSTDYGCGLGVRKMAGETVYSHGGAVSGFLAFNSFVPRTRTAVVLLVNSDHGSPGDIQQVLLNLVVSEARKVPKVSGPPAKEAALAIFKQMQAGKLDRAPLGEELGVYLSEARITASAARLRAFGDPKDVVADPPNERGGMEVTRVVFVFENRKVRALLYRSPDGKVQQLLLYRD